MGAKLDPRRLSLCTLQHQQKLGGVFDIHDDGLWTVKEAEVRWQSVEARAEEVIEKLHHTCRKSENPSVAAVVV